MLKVVVDRGYEFDPIGVPERREFLLIESGDDEPTVDRMLTMLREINVAKAKLRERLGP